MKTQNTDLKLTKQSIVELNNNELLQIHGGTSSVACNVAVAVAQASSQGCAEAAAAALVDFVQNLTQE